MKLRIFALALVLFMGVGAQAVFAYDEPVSPLVEEYPWLDYFGLKFRGQNYTYKDLTLESRTTRFNDLGITFTGTAAQQDEAEEISWSEFQYLGEIHYYPMTNDRDFSVFIGFGGHKTTTDFDINELNHSDFAFDLGVEGTAFWVTDRWSIDFLGRWYFARTDDATPSLIANTQETIDYTWTGYEIGANFVYDISLDSSLAGYDYIRPYFGFLYHTMEVEAEYHIFSALGQSKFVFDYENDEDEQLKFSGGVKIAGFWDDADLDLGGFFSQESYGGTLVIGYNF
jgi:hypothetical protein